MCSIFFLLTGCAVPPGYQPSGFIPPSDLSVTRLVNKGISEFNRNRYELAEESFVRASALKIASTTLVHNLTLNYFRLGAYPEAEAGWQKLLKRTPDDPNLHFEYGNYLVARGRYEQAIDSFNLALKSQRLLDEARLQKSAESLAKERLFVKTTEVGILPIVSAIMEVAFRAGYRQQAVCYAVKAALNSILDTKNGLNYIVAASRIATSMGHEDLALSLLQSYIPDVMQTRSGAVAYTIALISFSNGATDKFIEGIKNALESFDLTDEMREEIMLLRKVLKNPFDIEITGADKRRVIYWPIRLKEAFVASNWEEQEVSYLKGISYRLEESLSNAGLGDDELGIFDFLWFFN
jgi:tetratricopeptide (TPR) repeat protein